MINIREDTKNAYDISTTPIDKIVVDNQEYRISKVQFYDDCYQDGNIFGTAIAKCLEFEIENTVDLEGKEFEYLTGIKTQSGIEFISLGMFIVQDIDPNDTTKINKVYAMDYMLKANEEYISNLDYSSNEITILDVLQEACNNSSLALATTEFPNSDFIVTSNQFAEGIVNRQVFQAVAQISGTIAKIKNDNRLYFINPNEVTEVSKVFTLNNYKEAEIKRLTHPINVVTLGLTNIDGENITLRDEDSILHNGENILQINDNPFAYTQEKREQLIPALFNAVKGFEYKAYTFKCPGLPYMETLDKIQFKDKAGNTYDSYIFRFNFHSPDSLNSTIEAPSIIKAVVPYQNVPSNLDRTKRTEYLVDKQEQIINELVEQTAGNTSRIAEQQISINAINSSVKLIGGNNKQKNSIGAYGTEDYEQSETGHMVANEEELLKTKTDNGLGRIIYLMDNKWFKFKSDSLVVGDSYTVSFKYTNVEDNHLLIKLINNNETTLVDTYEDKELEKIEYTFIANTEFIELYVETGEGTAGITDYYLQTGNVATKWQPSSGEMLSTALSIYYDGIKVTSANSEIITNISNLGFTVENTNGKVLITFNKDRCIMNDAEINGTLYQGTWLRYTQNINSYNHLLEVENG